MALNAIANDAMVARLQNELQERNGFVQSLITAAEDNKRDLTEVELGTIGDAKSRMANLKAQLDQLEDAARVASEVSQRIRVVDRALSDNRDRSANGPIEYRSAGAYASDAYAAALGSREARDRLEVFERTAAHQKTSDNLGVVPDPIVGSVINFIDAARPMVQVLGPRALPGATWHRPKVTQHTTVAAQGSAGLAADEKSELVSQKMTITRLDGVVNTYGGYVNVSRQNIDFSVPSMWDSIINDLAAQYAIQTEAAVGTLISTATQTAEIPGTGSAAYTDANIRVAVWDAASQVFTATKGQGSLVLALAPDMLKNFGPAFSPVNPQNASTTGLSAGGFSSGSVGEISGINCIMTAGLGSGVAVLFSTAAFEVYEQRIGTLQVNEPSVLGVQVAYAGYFTPMVIELTGAVKLVNAT